MGEPVRSSQNRDDVIKLRYLCCNSGCCIQDSLNSWDPVTWQPINALIAIIRSRSDAGMDDCFNGILGKEVAGLLPDGSQVKDAGLHTRPVLCFARLIVFSKFALGFAAYFTTHFPTFMESVCTLSVCVGISWGAWSCLHSVEVCYLTFLLHYLKEYLSYLKNIVCILVYFKIFGVYIYFWSDLDLCQSFLHKAWCTFTPYEK